jgi:hypothetical protein
LSGRGVGIRGDDTGGDHEGGGERTNPEVTLTQSLPPFQRIARSEGKPFLHVIYIDYLAEIRAGKLKAGEM